MKRFFLLVNIIAFSLAALAQKPCFPQHDGEKTRYSVMIDFSKAYISGIGLIARMENKITGAVVNEFGVSALSFSYDTTKKKTKILYIMKGMNKWYIRRTLKHDISALMSILETCGTTYRNEKRNITYTFSPLKEQDETIE